VLLIHGIAESSHAWYAWVPHLARRFRVLRPDLPGFGQSTVPPPDYAWSAAAFAADLARLLDELQVESAHVVGAKFGGSIALQFAADYPERTRTLAIMSGPARAAGAGGRADLTSVPDRIRAVGVRHWVAETQRARLGGAASDQQMTYWTEYMAQTDPDVMLSVTTMVGRLDLYDALPRIQAQTLVVTTEGSALQAVAATREWQQRIRHSELLVLPGDLYHPAAVQPDRCAQDVLAFIQRHAASNRPGNVAL
jgi:pimeloyl-ACP methyl ester carboxylesterase